MIKTKADLHLYLQKDAEANKINSLFQYYIGLLIGRSNARVVRYLRILRKYEYYYNTSNPLRFLYGFLRQRIGSKYGILILPNTVGYGLYIPHLEGGIIINCLSMGNNCIVNSGVVIGNKNNQGNRATIGNNVETAVGAKIIGKVSIGDNSIIAPNAVVIKDVPEKTIVGGIPARILKSNE